MNKEEELEKYQIAQEKSKKKIKQLLGVKILLESMIDNSYYSENEYL